MYCMPKHANATSAAKPNGLEVPDNEVPKSAVFTMVVLLALIIILGLCPGLVTNGIYEFVGGIL